MERELERMAIMFYYGLFYCQLVRNYKHFNRQPHVRSVLIDVGRLYLWAASSCISPDRKAEWRPSLLLLN